jgi:hypothetical protein
VPQSKRHPARRPQQRPARPSHRNPAKAAEKELGVAPAPATGWRAGLERRSVGPLMVMTSLPGWLVPVLLGALLVAGLMLPVAWSGLLLLVPALFLGWLLLLSWPAIGTGGRLLRLAAVLVLLGAAVFRLLGNF